MVERGRAGWVTRHGSSPMAMTRRRAVGVEVKWRWASLVRALRTWSSMAPWRDFAAFDVSDGNAERERDGSGREHLVAVGDEKQQVGTPGGERVGQTEDGDADGLGHSSVGVGAEQALDAGLDGKAVALDFVDGRAELRREMRAEREDAQIYSRDGRRVRAAASRGGYSRRARW